MAENNLGPFDGPGIVDSIGAKNDLTKVMSASLGKNGPDWWCQESNANEELLLLTTQQQPAPKERKRSRVLQTSTHAFIDPVSPYAKNWLNRGRCSLEGATLLLFLLRPLFEINEKQWKLSNLSKNSSKWREFCTKCLECKEMFARFFSYVRRYVKLGKSPMSSGISAPFECDTLLF